MKAKLTEKLVRSIAAEPGQYLETWDTEWKVMGSSFGVRVSGTTGSRSWVLVYRREGEGKRMTLGSFPGMTLAQARAKATEIASSVVLGADPVALKKAAKAADTFEEVAERFLVQWPKVSPYAPLKPSTVAEYERVIRKDMIPRWGDRKAAEITRADVVALLDEIRVERDAPIHSNRVRALVSCLFTWAVQRDLVPSTPAVALPDRAQEHSRERTLSDEEVKILWGILEYEAEPVRSFYRLLVVCGQRVGETRLAKWEHIKNGVWHLPAEDTKASRAHKVPLSALALTILADLRPVTGKSKYVFETPSVRGTGPVRWHHRATERIRNRCGIPHWTAHDLRRTCGTGLRELDVAPDVIARILNHADSVAVPGSTPVYIRTERWPQQVEAMRLWGAHVQKIISEDEVGRKAG